MRASFSLNFNAYIVSLFSPRTTQQISPNISSNNMKINLFFINQLYCKIEDIG